MANESKMLTVPFHGERMPLPATEQTVLYKYFGPPNGKETFAESNLEDLLVNNKVRLSSNSEVNDPADSTPYIDQDNTDADLRKYLNRLTTRLNSDPTTERMRLEFAALVKNRKGRQKFIKENGAQLAEAVVEHSKVSFSTAGFTCMTRLWSNRLMWSHYAQSHKGVCIGFRTQPTDDEKTLPFAANFLPVTYISERPVWSMKAMMQGDLQNEVTKQTLLQKDDVWSYEEEWRFVAQIHEKGHPFKGGAIIEIGTNEISEVIFGMKSNNKTKRKINDMLAKSGKKPDLYQTDFQKKSFELIRNLI